VVHQIEVLVVHHIVVEVLQVEVQVVHQIVQVEVLEVHPEEDKNKKGR